MLPQLLTKHGVQVLVAGDDLAHETQQFGRVVVYYNRMLLQHPGCAFQRRHRKRLAIDVLAAALWNEMNVGELLNIDLSYAPPFSPVWDAVLIAARKAWSLVEASSSET